MPDRSDGRVDIPALDDPVRPAGALVRADVAIDEPPSPVLR